jgi:hypothetical protein
MISFRSPIAILFPLIVIATILQPTVQAQESMREWTDQSGKFRVKAKFESVDNDSVVLNKADGTQIRVPISRLSPTDQDYLAKLSSTPPSRSKVAKNPSKVPVTEVLKSPVSFTFSNQPLTQCVKQISEELSINIILSMQNGRNTGSIERDTQISYTPSNQSFADALDSILTPLNLAWTDLDGVLLITPDDASPFVLRVYRAKTPVINYSYVMEIISNVAPATWVENGSSGVIQILPPNRIVVYNRNSVLRELEKNYPGKLVSEAMGGVAGAAAKKKNAPSPTGLDRPISIDFQQTPLRICLTKISDMTKLNLNMDENSMSEIGISPDNPVTLKLENVRAETVLMLMLEPLALSLVEDKETISITSRQQANRTLLSAEHNTAGILGNDLSPIIQLITNVIAPDSWEQNGGDASISVKPPNSISVRQTADNHTAIKKLLADLRESSR